MAALTAELRAKIEAYLLGRLPSEQQPQIEALLFEDDEMFEAIRDAEDDLIDRYLGGELLPADREAFEHTFATSTSRQERIAIARALSQGLASGSPAPAPAPPAAVTAVQARRRRASAARRFSLPAGAALVAVLAIAIAWRTWLAPSDPGVSPSPDERAVATFPLERIDSLRGTGNLPRLRLPEGTTTLRLQPTLEAPSPVAGYAVALRRVEGQVVWQGTTHDDGQGRVSVTVPAQLMEPGDYVLSLAAAGTPPDDRAEYAFRIVARD